MHYGGGSLGSLMPDWARQEMGGGRSSNASKNVKTGSRGEKTRVNRIQTPAALHYEKNGEKNQKTAKVKNRDSPRPKGRMASLGGKK